MVGNLAKVLAAASFAAKKHANQRRKGETAEPYINHPLEAANILAGVGGVTDPDILAAALLHDTVEDTGTTAEEIAQTFGRRVCDFVTEVTDDKSLPKDVRKEKQVEHAPHLSTGAKQIKLADKISNISDITNNPPRDWSMQRRIEYVEWGERVAAGLRGSNEKLEALFDETILSAHRKFDGS
jgi:GTP diphosphokinase / guanosine-3',5'-bis(diphosphate) 3'-diphosphatase